MQAKKGGAPAYQHAKRKHQIAEDQYFKSLFEIDVMEAKLKILAGPGSMFVDIIKTIAQCNDILSMTPTDPEKKAIVQQQQPLVSLHKEKGRLFPKFTPQVTLFFFFLCLIFHVSLCACNCVCLVEKLFPRRAQRCVLPEFTEGYPGHIRIQRRKQSCQEGSPCDQQLVSQ